MYTLLLLAFLPSIHSLPVIPRSLDTRNDLLNGPCQAITVLYARGTSEAGNIGAVVGPWLVGALYNSLGANVAFQGVDYAATIEGYLAGGSSAGASTLLSLIDTAASKCPNTQVVLGGYSQGAQVVYKAAAQLADGASGMIKAAVLFGNPNDGEAVPNIDGSDVRTFCHAGDLICEGQPIVLAPHLTYGTDTGAAASFIASKVSL